MQTLKHSLDNNETPRRAIVLLGISCLVITLQAIFSLFGSNLYEWLDKSYQFSGADIYDEYLSGWYLIHVMELLVIGMLTVRCSLSSWLQNALWGCLAAALLLLLYRYFHWELISFKWHTMAIDALIFAAATFIAIAAEGTKRTLAILILLYQLFVMFLVLNENAFWEMFHRRYKFLWIYYIYGEIGMLSILSYYFTSSRYSKVLPFTFFAIVFVLKVCFSFSENSLFTPVMHIVFLLFAIMVAIHTRGLKQAILFSFIIVFFFMLMACFTTQHFLKVPEEMIYSEGYQLYEFQIDYTTHCVRALRYGIYLPSFILSILMQIAIVIDELTKKKEYGTHLL